MTSDTDSFRTYWSPAVKSRAGPGAEDTKVNHI